MHGHAVENDGGVAVDEVNVTFDEAILDVNARYAGGVRGPQLHGVLETVHFDVLNHDLVAVRQQGERLNVRTAHRRRKVVR